MFQHPEIMRFLVKEHLDALQRAARPPLPGPHATVTEPAGIELRLCRVADDPELEELAVLAERPLPSGRFIVAVVDGRLVAALPLAGGHVLADPFVRTAHLLPLLELRAAQLREPVGRRSLLPRAVIDRYVNLIRGSIHA
jgi:hypothetical protein